MFVVRCSAVEMVNGLFNVLHDLSVIPGNFLGNFSESQGFTVRISMFLTCVSQVLDDEVRSLLCPDKINTNQWLEVHFYVPELCSLKRILCTLWNNYHRRVHDHLSVDPFIVNGCYKPSLHIHCAEICRLWKRHI